MNCRARWCCFCHCCTDDTATSSSSSSSSPSSSSLPSLHCVKCTHVLQASSAALSPKFLKGIKAHMQVRRTPSRIVSSLPHTHTPPSSGRESSPSASYLQPSTRPAPTVLLHQLHTLCWLTPAAAASGPMLNLCRRQGWCGWMVTCRCVRVAACPCVSRLPSDTVTSQLPLRLGLPKIMPGFSGTPAAALPQPSKAAAAAAAAAAAPVDLTAASFTSLPRIPCASVLIRVQVQRLPQSSSPSPAPAIASSPSSSTAPSHMPVLPLPSLVSLDTAALEAAISPPPLYSDGFYDSTACTPTGSEVSM